jgi:dTDP-4-amino-4,6-dideoxygalactose transaminase
MNSIKAHVEQLAVFGGVPAFSEMLHVGRPNLGDPELFLSEVRKIFERRWLTNDGPCVRALEDRVRAVSGTRHCVAVSNGTVALEIAVRALGLSDEVIVPSFTFAATAHAVAWQGLTPVFADADPNTHNLDVEDVRRRVTPRTTGIVATHVWGRPCAVQALTALAEELKLRLIFDAAHAFGCTLDGKPIGGFGNAEVFSFHATKFFNTFEGGAIVTNDDQLAARARSIRNFGFAGFDDVAEIGTNAKMTEVCAAMGLAGFETLPSVVEVNRRNHEQYCRELSELPGVEVVRFNDADRSNFQYVVLIIEAQRAGLTRDELLAVLQSENVLARRYFSPGLHRMRAYAKGADTPSLPGTEWIADRVLSLPNGTAVTSADIQVIGSIVRTALASSAAVKARLAMT